MYHWLSFCGLVSLYQKTSGTLEEVWPEQGSQLNGLHPYVHSKMGMGEGYDYFDYMNPANPNCCKYILLREIGQGKNARVYISVDEDGEACAMKFFLDRVDLEIDFRGRAQIKVLSPNQSFS